jgi:hypothetical protein
MNYERYYKKRGGKPYFGIFIVTDKASVNVADIPAADLGDALIGAHKSLTEALRKVEMEMAISDGVLSDEQKQTIKKLIRK